MLAVLAMALNRFQFDLQLLHLTTAFLSTNHIRSVPRTFLQVVCGSGQPRRLAKVSMLSCAVPASGLWSASRKPDRTGSHEPVWSRYHSEGLTFHGDVLRVLASWRAESPYHRV